MHEQEAPDRAQLFHVFLRCFSSSLDQVSLPLPLFSTCKTDRLPPPPSTLIFEKTAAVAARAPVIATPPAPVPVPEAATSNKVEQSTDKVENPKKNPVSSATQQHETTPHQQQAQQSGSASHGGGGGRAGDARPKPTNEQIREFNLLQLREEVVLQRSRANRKSTLDDGDLSPEDCVAYMRAVIDRVVALQDAGRVASESDFTILQGIKETIETQIDTMKTSNVSAELYALKQLLWSDVRKAISTPKATPQSPRKM